MKIIAGLGNPGEKYQKSRHNAGWIFLDNLIKNPNWRENKKFKALIHEKGEFLFVKPLTYMNESGYSLRKIMDYYGLIPKRIGLFNKRIGLFNKKNFDLTESLLVIQDELDLDFGTTKISTNSGSAGHKGIESIISHLNTNNFKRLRLGIKNNLLKTRIPADKFVLQPFSHEELEALKKLAADYPHNSLI